MAALVFAGMLSGCGEDTPERAEGVVVPGGKRDPDHGDQSEEPDNPNNPDNPDNPDNPGSEEAEETTPIIVGSWSATNGSVAISFDADGMFEATAWKGMGFHSTDEKRVSGTYTYDDFKRWLWLTIQNEHEIYMVDYKCVIAEKSMTLYPQTGQAIQLYK